MIRRTILLLALPVLVAVGETQQQGGDAAQPAATPEIATDSLGRMVFRREVFAYPRDGRRDPFASLIATGDVRPLFVDLVITGIYVDPSGRRSMAMLKDQSTDEIYKVRVGSVFGRLRVTFIRAGEVGIAIDEFGYSRQEVLALNAPRRGKTP